MYSNHFNTDCDKHSNMHGFAGSQFMKFIDKLLSVSLNGRVEITGTSCISMRGLSAD